MLRLITNDANNMNFNKEKAITIVMALYVLTILIRSWFRC